MKCLNCQLEFVIGEAQSAKEVPKPSAVAGVPKSFSPVPAQGSLERCARHPEVEAITRCKVCQTPLCSTCEFTFPGELHLCPQCASQPKPKLGRGRKKSLVAGYILAIWTTLGLGLLVSGAWAGSAKSPQEYQLLAAAIGFLSFIPSIIGMALSVGCLDRRLFNPPSIWIAVGWNSLILAVFILLSIGAMAD